MEKCCPHCEGRVPQDHRFCGYCGIQFEDDSALGESEGAGIDSVLDAGLETEGLPALIRTRRLSLAPGSEDSKGAESGRSPAQPRKKQPAVRNPMLDELGAALEELADQFESFAPELENLETARLEPPPDPDQTLTMQDSVDDLPTSVLGLKQSFDDPSTDSSSALEWRAIPLERGRECRASQGPRPSREATLLDEMAAGLRRLVHSIEERRPDDSESAPDSATVDISALLSAAFEGYEFSGDTEVYPPPPTSIELPVRPPIQPAEPFAVDDEGEREQPVEEPSEQRGNLRSLVLLSLISAGLGFLTLLVVVLGSGLGVSRELLVAACSGFALVWTGVSLWAWNQV